MGGSHDQNYRITLKSWQYVKQTVVTAYKCYDSYSVNQPLLPYVIYCTVEISYERKGNDAQLQPYFYFMAKLNDLCHLFLKDPCNTVLSAPRWPLYWGHLMAMVELGRCQFYLIFNVACEQDTVIT